MNGQHACCPTCTIKERGTENCSKRINLIDFAAESGWQPDALSHVRDYICGNWTTEDVVVQPLIRPWAYSHTQNRVFRGRLKHTHAYTTHTLLHYHPLKQLLLVYTPSHTHAHIHTLAYARCRSQCSTWGVTVEREGHWEMLLATCRASILRAASTSSSWAARKWYFWGVYGKKCGPRMREQRENIQILELREYTSDAVCYLCSMNHTEWRKVQFRCKDTQN